jgi:hypothetical protein
MALILKTAVFRAYIATQKMLYFLPNIIHLLCNPIMIVFILMMAIMGKEVSDVFLFQNMDIKIVEKS